jgi:hypothetical protein
MQKFAIKQMSLGHDQRRGPVVDVLLMGPSGEYALGIRVVNGDSLDFTSTRQMHFVDGLSRLTISPLVGASVERDGTLLLTVDGEALPPIPLAPDEQD